MANWDPIDTLDAHLVAHQALIGTPAGGLIDLTADYVWTGQHTYRRTAGDILNEWGSDASEYVRATHELGDGILTNVTSRSLRLTSSHPDWVGGLTEDVLTIYTGGIRAIFRLTDAGTLSIGNGTGLLDPVLTQNVNAGISANWTQSGTYTVTGTQTIDPSTGVFATNNVAEASNDVGVDIDGLLIYDSDLFGNDDVDRPLIISSKRRDSVGTISSIRLRRDNTVGNSSWHTEWTLWNGVTDTVAARLSNTGVLSIVNGDVALHPVVTDNFTLTGGLGIDTIGDLSTNRTIAVDIAEAFTGANAWAGTHEHSSHITFTTGNVEVGGIENQNLLDKSATETVSGAYTFTQDILSDGGIYTYGNAPGNSSNTFTRTLTGADITASNTYRDVTCKLAADPDGDTGIIMYGLDCTSILNGSTSAGTVVGGLFKAQANTTGGTLTHLYGGDFQAQLFNSFDGATVTNFAAGVFRQDYSEPNGSITTGSGIRVNTPTAPSGGTTVTNHSGIDVLNQGTGFGGTRNAAIRIRTQSGGASAGNMWCQGGTWNNGHFQLDTGHIWFDDTNDVIRVKGSAPANETDGFAIIPDSWDDLRVPALSVKIPASGNPTFVQFMDDGAASQGVFLYFFSASSEEEVYFVAQLPHTYKEGSDLYPHVHWVGNTTEGGAGTDVSWGLEYTLADVNGTFGNTTIIYADEQSNGAGETITADKHYATSFAAISGTGLDVSAMLVCRLFRDAAGVGGTDDYSGEAGLLEFDFHHQIDSTGSESEFDKDIS